MVLFCTGAINKAELCGDFSFLLDVFWTITSQCSSFTDCCMFVGIVRNIDGQNQMQRRKFRKLIHAAIGAQTLLKSAFGKGCRQVESPRESWRAESFNAA